MLVNTYICNVNTYICNVVVSIYTYMPELQQGPLIAGRVHGWLASRAASACAKYVAACAAACKHCNVLDAHMGSAIPTTTTAALQLVWDSEDSDTRTYKAFSHGRFALNVEHVSAVRMTIYGSLLVW